MIINFMVNSWVFSDVISRGSLLSRNAYKGEKMQNILLDFSKSLAHSKNARQDVTWRWDFDGLWNGESFRNWFDSEVDKNAEFQKSESV